MTNLVQEMILLCYDQVKAVIKEVNCNILKILNLNEKSEAEIKRHLANFYQDNHNTIFKLNEERLEKIKNQYKKNIDKVFAHTYTNELMNIPPEDENDEKSTKEEKKENEEKTNENEQEENIENNKEEKDEEENPFQVEIREEYQEQFEEMLETDDFSKFVNNVFYLCLFMLLNDPPLRVPIEGFKNRKFIYKKFKKNDYICVDGFAKENSPCLVLLPAVTRNNYPYNGIKPSVLILQEDFITPKIKKVLEECEREEQERLAKKQEKELQEEKLNQTEKITEKAKDISIEEKILPQSLNTTKVNEPVPNPIRSNSMVHVHQNDITLAKGVKIEDSSSHSHRRLSDNSKENEEPITSDITVRANKIPNTNMILPREGLDDSLHNQTIP